MHSLSVYCATVVDTSSKRILRGPLLLVSAFLLLRDGGRCLAFSVAGPSRRSSLRSQQPHRTRRTTGTSSSSSSSQIRPTLIYRNHYDGGARIAINDPSGPSSPARCFATAIGSTPEDSSAVADDDAVGRSAAAAAAAAASSIMAEDDDDDDGEVIEYWDDDDDDNDDDSTGTVETTWTYADYLGELQALARITSRDPTAVDRAASVVDRMFRAHVSSDGGAPVPDTAVYNQLLAVLAFSPVPGAADEAARIVERMERQRDGGSATTAAAPPDSETYATLMDAHLQRRDYPQVLRIVEHLKAKDASLVDTVVLNKLIQSYGRQGDPAAARQILDDMLKNNSTTSADGDGDDGSSSSRKNAANNIAEPNHKTWVHVLRAHAARGDAEKVRELLGIMARGYRRDGRADWAASTAARNALLQAHAVCSDAPLAEQVLYEMLEEEEDDSSSSEPSSRCRPDPQSFSFLLQAYSRQSPRPGVAFKVEQCLSLFDAWARKQQQQTGGDNKESSSWKLTARTLQTAVAAMARDTTDPLKAVKAARLLEERLGETLDGDAATPSSHGVYRSLLNACAHTTRKASPEDKLATFRVAIDAFNQLTQRQRDARVYGQFLRTVGRLLPPGAKRDNVVSKIFDQCCAAGCVDDYVLEMLEKAASDQLLLAKLGGFLEDGVEMPEEWSRKVVEKEQ